MREDELIKKLENVSLPDIKSENHKNRLSRIFLDKDIFKKVRGETKSDRGIPGWFWEYLKNLIPKTPVMRTAAVTVFIVMNREQLLQIHSQ